MDHQVDQYSTSSSAERREIPPPVGLDRGNPVISGFTKPGWGCARAGSVEWPTILVAVVIYAGWLALTGWHAVFPIWALLLLGGVVAGWHSSFQHEATHGHPTGNIAVNAFLAGPSLLLWLPFGIFRREHLRHHGNGRLTDPIDDPESFYVLERDWRVMNPLRRVLLVVNNALAGRLLIGPALVISGFLWSELARLVRRDFSHLADWTWHLLGLAPVIGWLALVAEMPFWIYLLCFSYPGTAIILLRSFNEHRPAFDLEQRTAIVEAGPVLSLLFLNNNLHAVHHARPDLPWYRIPEAYWPDRERILAGNGGFFLPGYGALARRYLFRTKDHPVHPVRRR